MPLTEFQKSVLKLIAANRSVDSHIAGGIVINAAEDSHDVDIFHEAAVEVARSSNLDVSLLEKNGYEVKKYRGDWEK